MKRTVDGSKFAIHQVQTFWGVIDIPDLTFKEQDGTETKTRIHQIEYMCRDGSDAYFLIEYTEEDDR